MKTIIQNCREVGSSAYWGDRGDWLIVLAVHRDSDALSRSNFEVAEQALKALPEVKGWQGENGPVEIVRFNHWAVGWVDYLCVNPECKPAVTLAESMREKLEDYPVLDEEHYSQTEQTEADETWRNCYNERERVKYIREHRSQFEFHDLADLLGCVRGKYFAGYASELLN